MATKIFGVEFECYETVDGKDGSWFKENQNVVATDVKDAIAKVEKKQSKPYSFIDDETKKKVTCRRSKFEFLNVILRAQAD